MKVQIPAHAGSPSAVAALIAGAPVLAGEADDRTLIALGDKLAAAIPEERKRIKAWRAAEAAFHDLAERKGVFEPDGDQGSKFPQGWEAYAAFWSGSEPGRIDTAAADADNAYAASVMDPLENAIHKLPAHTPAGLAVKALNTLAMSRDYGFGEEELRDADVDDELRVRLALDVLRVAGRHDWLVLVA